ncbi:MAG: alpha/beta fold hydrolase [Saprospiraceae bacterium]|nr:alpha/beta fold hydrolase [Saprospiraceae bacterium]
MPYSSESTYEPSNLVRNGHLETLLPYLLRKKTLHYRRERISTKDDDFLDLDWFGAPSENLAILCHGLEGHSNSQYMIGMSNALVRDDWQILAMNFRSCSGEMNRSKRMYHHGETEDLSYVIDSMIDRGYRNLALVGFSLGGNVILKYLGTHTVPDNVQAASAISVPCDLASSAEAIDRGFGYVYTLRFRKSLRKKLTAKNEQYPGMLPMHLFSSCKTWREFDDTFTCIINDFQSADEYYQQGSAGNFVEGIRTPTLLLNALNDPFLRAASYPIQKAKQSEWLTLETPSQGGHVGFWRPGMEMSYAESRTLAFIGAQIA